VSVADAREAIIQAHRKEWARVVATLTRRFGDLDIAEEAVAEAFGPRLFVSDWKEASDRLGDADILVNTTSLGMSGQDQLAIDISQLKAGAIVADAVYVPLETDLIRDARRLGHRAVGGLGMLLHQAAPGFERWFGIRPSVTSELRGLVEADILGLGAKVS